MRPSPRRHVVAILRLFLGLQQGEFAALVGCSRELIKSVELDRTRLSRELALKISYATGVDEQWLLANDKTLSPTTEGRVYTREDFENHKGQQTIPLEDEVITATPGFLFGYYKRLRGICASAGLRGSADWWRAFHRLDLFVEEMRREFGTVPEIDDRGKTSSFNINDLSFVEHDLAEARELATKEGGGLSAPPTPQTIKKHKKFRRKYEFPTAKGTES